MAARRGLQDVRPLCAGPGRPTQALGIDISMDGARLDAPPFHLEKPKGIVRSVTGRRSGITQAVDVPWRFGLAGSRYLSRPLPNGGRRLENKGRLPIDSQKFRRACE